MTKYWYRFIHWLEEKAKGPTISETIKKSRLEYEQSLQHAVNTIHSHAFQEHMARSHLAALDAWERGSDVLSKAYRPLPKGHEGKT